MAKFLEEYKKKLVTRYPTAGGVIDLSARLDHLISDIVVELPKSVLARVEIGIKKIVAHAYAKNRLEFFRQTLTPPDLAILDAAPAAQNPSVLMAYDFHYDSMSDGLSLIEINTNAAAFLLSELLYKTYDAAFVGGTDSNCWPLALEHLKLSFENSFQLSGRSPQILIMDETPASQKMYTEFLMYQDFFKSFGWSSQIVDPQTVVQVIEKRKVEATSSERKFIYNRYTDFKFTNETSKTLLAAYLNGQVIFSPNPRDYLLLAEKSNLIEFAKDNVSELIIPAFNLKNHKDPDSVWANRKQYIFKPKNSFGSRGVYKGSSISNKIFLEILNQDFIAQEFRPPGLVGPWKYDLRFFVYQSEIQLAVARVYQGQVTNFRTPGGGLARLYFT